MDQRLVKALVELLAQPGDVHVNHVGLRVEVIVPHLLEQHGAGDDLPGMAHQVLEQAELARLHVYALAGARHRAREQVHLEIGDAELGGRRVHGRAAAERFHASEELGEGEGLDEIVVAPGLEPLHPLVHRGERREEEDRGLVALGAQGFHQAHAIHAARQHAVEHQHVELLRGGEEESVAAIGRVLHRVPGLLEALAHEAGDLGIVLDQ